MTDSNSKDDQEMVPEVGIDRYKKYRGTFLVIGAVSGYLMGEYTPGPERVPGMWISDVLGGVFLWYILWWLWARSRSRKDASDA